MKSYCLPWASCWPQLHETIFSLAVHISNAHFEVKPTPVHTPKARASPATAALVCVTAHTPGSGLGAAPLCQGQWCWLGRLSCHGWHRQVLTASVATAPCCHMWESPSCRNLACCIWDGCVQVLSRQKNAELASTSCTLTRWEVPALINLVFITESYEFLWIPTNSSISTQLLF